MHRDVTSVGYRRAETNAKFYNVLLGATQQDLANRGLQGQLCLATTQMLSRQSGEATLASIGEAVLGLLKAKIGCDRGTVWVLEERKLMSEAKEDRAQLQLKAPNRTDCNHAPRVQQFGWAG